jgi:hypothetical protein
MLWQHHMRPECVFPEIPANETVMNIPSGDDKEEKDEQKQHRLGMLHGGC